MVAVILNDIRSLYNVGAIFRTCDAAGVDKLFLCGITGRPDQSVKVQKKIAKTALGNVENIDWKYYKDINYLLSTLKKKNWQVISVEQTPKSINYKTFKPSAKTAFVFGNEVDGVAKKVLNNSDAVIELPMKGKAKSLNVATSIGIILYHYL